MQVTTFSCPHCAAILRIRDRMFVGKTVGCPDCGEQLAIVADGAKGFRAEKVVPTETPGRTKSTTKRKRRSRKPPGEPSAAPADPPRERLWLKAIREKLLSPVGIAWTTAIVAATVLVAFMLSGPDTPSNGNGNGGRSTAAAGDDPAAGKKPQVNPWSTPADDARGRMQHLSMVLAEYEKSHKHLPPGSVAIPGLAPERSLSWLARLAADSNEYGAVPPHWDRPWSDPVNERFRTQSIELFRNPRLPATPGRDRLPVAHFAGVAGVGSDGPRLPVDHPRAGLFGYGRSTRLADVKDGLENTMMIAGVQSRLRGWAVGGPGTIRPFTKTPYVNGPDGFGTGHNDRMLVLMADGSIREVAAKTNPVIVRRMAALADGFSLDPRLPGDPALAKPKTRIGPPPVVGKKEPARKKPPRVAAKPARAKRPRPRPEDEEPKPLDVAGALAQPILQFEQQTPQPLEILLDELEELVGVPIRFDKQKLAARMRRRVAVKLKNTTVEAILRALLAEAGLAYKIEADGLRVVVPSDKPVKQP